MTPIVGVKAYGWEWATKFGLTMSQAADLMAKQGIDRALVQNLIDPLPGSAVAQQRPECSYDDRAWVAELRNAGIRTYQSTAVLFNPDHFQANPASRPVGASGQTFQPLTWYFGICPCDTAYLKAKAERFAEALAVTEPDGVFLSFLRWPGFWETWLPGMQRDEIEEYCFCDRCTTCFQEETGLTLPTDFQRRTALLQGELRLQWTDFKCRRIATIAAELRAVAQSVLPDVDVVLNGFGLGSADFENAVVEVLGQRFAELDPVIDTYELMFYFQIQKRDPTSWIPGRIAEAKQQTNRTILACLQGGAEYLEPVYAAAGRKQILTPKDWRNALAAVAASGAAGVMIYSWRDLLAEPSRVSELIAYKERGLTSR